MSGGYAETVALHGRWRTARKAHVCDNGGCRNVIRTGDRYLDTGIGEPYRAGGFGTSRHCAACAEIPDPNGATP